MNSQLLDAVGLVLAVAAFMLAGVRWLRVAQREHYLPGATVRFARRWWDAGALNRAMGLLGGAGAVVSAWYPVAGVAAVLAGAAGPVGLSLRGRTSKLAWTSRLRRLATLGVALAAAVVAVAGGVGGLHPALTAAAICTLGVPALTDGALWVLRPLESRFLRAYVERARQRLRAVSPRIVAITGSYGKTTTKGYVAHLVSGASLVVATPASFNNTAGLARAVNEHLATGTNVFVAEMGTYGRGEIAAMCEWAAPEVAVITAIGPVHIERMKTLETIAEAKAEILAKAEVAVLNVDYPLLEQLAQKAEEEGKTVWRCSSRGPRADVTVVPEDGKLHVRAAHFDRQMDLLVAAPIEVEPGNVACAVAAALALGISATVVAERLGNLPGAPHRRSPQHAANGANIIDDTYNSNPDGARAALALLAVTGA